MQWEREIIPPVPGETIGVVLRYATSYCTINYEDYYYNSASQPSQYSMQWEKEIIPPVPGETIVVVLRSAMSYFKPCRSIEKNYEEKIGKK